jgi:hypothetical protein
MGAGVRVRVRVTDGTIMAMTSTDEHGAATLVFYKGAKEPEQIEVVTPMLRKYDGHPIYNGAVAPYEGSRDYCVIVPPDCMF